MRISIWKEWFPCRRLEKSKRLKITFRREITYSPRRHEGSEVIFLRVLRGECFFAFVLKQILSHYRELGKERIAVSEYPSMPTAVLRSRIAAPPCCGFVGIGSVYSFRRRPGHIGMGIAAHCFGGGCNRGR